MSTLAAAVPIFVLLLLIGVLRKPAWIAGLSGLAAGLVMAIVVYKMPVTLAVSSTLMGAAFGLLPIAWIVYWAVVLYRLTLETGNFDIIKDSIGSLTADRRLQAMLIAFAFGAFVEGAAGFGTPAGCMMGSQDHPAAPWSRPPPPSPRSGCNPLCRPSPAVETRVS